STDEPADGTVEKILVLIELDDVIAWGRVRHHSLPGLPFPRAARFTIDLTVHCKSPPIEDRLSYRPAADQAWQSNCRAQPQCRVHDVLQMSSGNAVIASQHRDPGAVRGFVVGRSYWLPVRLGGRKDGFQIGNIQITGIPMRIRGVPHVRLPRWPDPSRAEL